jgi:membrane-associated phospholipid phosphatase
VSSLVAELRQRTLLLGVFWLVLLALAATATLLLGDAFELHALHDPAWVAAHRRPIDALSHYGMLPFYGLFVVTLAVGAYTRDPRWIYLALGYVLAQLLGPVITVRALKMVVARGRPDLVDHPGADTLPSLTWSAAFHSFPSGHAADLVTSMIFVALLAHRVWVTGFVLAWAIAVGWSRVALAKHFPSDVIGGAAIGVVAALGVLHLWVAPRWERALASRRVELDGATPSDIISPATHEEGRRNRPDLANRHYPPV